MSNILTHRPQAQNKIPSARDPSKGVLDVIPFIQLNKEVTKITYGPSSTGGQTKIDCSDGTAYTADYVICTVSIGVLNEKHLTMFDPLLPRAKINCAQSLRLGVVNKIYLEYEQPFWDRSVEHFGLLWKKEQSREARADPANGEWLESIFAFNLMESQPNVICAWLSGRGAERMEGVSDADAKCGAEKVLQMFLKLDKAPVAKAMIR